MSKAKSNDKDFLHDNNNKADKKNNLWCKEHPSSERRDRPFCLTSTQQSAVSQSNQKFPYTEPGCKGGCVHAVKWLETQQWMLWFSPLKAIIWLMLGFLKTLRDIDFSALTTLGLLFLERFCTA